MDNESNNKDIKQEVLPDQYFLKEKIVSKLHKIECVLILSVTVNNLGAWNKKFGFYQIHWPLTHRLTELLIIFERLDNRKMFILLNTTTAWKIYNYTSKYYLLDLCFHKHIQMSQLCVCSRLWISLLYSFPDNSNYFLGMGFSFRLDVF